MILGLIDAKGKSLSTPSDFWSFLPARIVNTHGQYIGMDVEIVNSSVNTAFLKNGLYFLVLESEKEIFTTKFIVLH